MSLKYRLAAAPFRAAAAFKMLPKPRTPIAYVVEKANWSIGWDGTYICRGVERVAPGIIERTSRPERQIGKIVHFGSQYQWLAWHRALPRSNISIATFFHGKPEDGEAVARHVDAFLASVGKLRKVVTSSQLVEARLLSWGVPRQKLVRIPISVDLDLFTPITPEQRQTARARYRIPDDCLVVGSFQKDGVGWGDGVEPKLIKGPDILVDAVARVARHRPVFVMLTGPARGFVKHRLERLGILYAHEYVDDYLSLPQRYAPLDVYINPSREEGGPKGVLEALASGIPVVSTAVGMAPELIGANRAGRLVEPGDGARLADEILDLDTNRDERDQMIVMGRKAVEQCHWTAVGRRHYEEVYRPLVEVM